MTSYVRYFNRRHGADGALFIDAVSRRQIEATIVVPG